MDRVTGSREATSRLRVCAIGDSMWNDIKGAVNEVREGSGKCRGGVYAPRPAHSHRTDRPDRSTHMNDTQPQGYGSIFIADGIHAEALGVGQAAGQPVSTAALASFFKVGLVMCGV